MNTKVLMTLSAVILGIIGFTLSFIPEEFIGYLKVESNSITILLFQLLGSLYLGFGILNWMAKGSIIGGIYNKPIVIGNLMHFGVGAITFFKIGVGNEMILFPTVIYTILSLAFLFVFMKSPIKEAK